MEDSLLFAGSAFLELERMNGVMKVFWDGAEIFSEIDFSVINQVKIEFWYYAYGVYAVYPCEYQSYDTAYSGISYSIALYPIYRKLTALFVRTGR